MRNDGKQLVLDLGLILELFVEHCFLLGQRRHLKGFLFEAPVEQIDRVEHDQQGQCDDAETDGQIGDQSLADASERAGFLLFDNHPPIQLGDDAGADQHVFAGPVIFEKPVIPGHQGLGDG